MRSGSRPCTTWRFSSSTCSIAEPARDALVGERRVDVAVADDVGAALERRPDRPARRARRARPRRAPPPPTASSSARGGRARARARRARVPPGSRVEDASRPSATSASREQLGLRRLAGAVDSFEGDEHALPTIRRSAGDRDRRRGLHRLARRRRPARPRRRGARRRRPLDRPARERARARRAARGRHPAARRGLRRRAARRGVPSRRAGRRPRLGGATRTRTRT